MIDRISRLFRRNGNEDTGQPVAPEKPAPASDPETEARRAQQQADIESRHAEIVRSTDTAALLEAALHDKAARVRLAAAEKLQDVTALERLRRESNDKAVQRHVRDTLKALREQENAAQELQQRIRHLLDAIAHHAGRSGIEPLYEAKLDSLESHWREISSAAAADQQERFAEQAALCRDTINRHAAELAGRAHAITAKQELIAACGELEATVGQLAREDLSTSVSAVAALRSIQQTRWDEAAVHTAVDAPLAARFRAAARHLDRWLAAVAELARAGAETAAVFADAGEHADAGLDRIDDWQHTLEELRARIDWPEHCAVPPALTDIDEALQQLAKRRRALQADVRDQLAQLRKRRGALRHMIDEGQLRVAVRTHHWLQKRIAELPAREAAQEQAALVPLTEALAKLHDWYEFASVPRKTELCERIEALAAVDAFTDSNAVAGRAAEVRDLRERWNALCAADPDADPELRARFDRAAKLAFAPCAAWYDAQHRKQDDNLAARAALCDSLAAELATLTSAPPADTAGWRKLEHRERDLRAQWKTLEPVRWPEARAGQDRFHALLGELRKLLDGERRRNADAKRALVARAQALISHEPLPAALNAARALQEDWKKIGWTDPRDDRALWQQFRSHLDAVFARREQARDAERAARDAERAAREAEAAEAARKRADDDARRAAQAQALRAARQEEIDAALALATAESAWLDGTAADGSVSGRIEALPGKSPLVTSLRQRAQHMATGIRPDARTLATNGDTLARLTLELEILLDVPSPPELAQARMQAKIGRLNDALRHRSAQEPRNADPKRALEDAWLSTGPVTADVRTPLQERFRRALGS